jgi:3-hydroxymyristoyl/3-hydroxydecanoyl-(acyl carrier protein) dehydratase
LNREPLVSNKERRHPNATHFDARRRRVNLWLTNLFYDRSKLEAIFLPIGQMLQLDRVTDIQGSRLYSEMDVRNHWVFPMHFPSDPIFPGSLIIEASGQTVAVWAWHAGLRGRPRMLRVSAKFKSPVLQDDGPVAFHANVHQSTNLCVGNVAVNSGDRLVAEVRAVVIVLPT